MTASHTVELVERQARRVLSPDGRRWLLSERLLTASDVGSLLGLSTPGPYVRRWREQRAIFGIPVRRGHVYPAFQFDAEQRRIRPDVAQRNLAHVGDCWSLVEVWASHLTDG